MKIKHYALFCLLSFCCSCSQQQAAGEGPADKMPAVAAEQWEEAQAPASAPEVKERTYDSAYDRLPDSAMVELIRMDPSFVLDIKYATTDNFTGKVLYDCGRCFLRKKVAKDLIRAHQKFKKQGYRIKIFDGYRPLSVQWKLWNTVSDKNYVSDPRKGSMHNRGCAVDLTLVDASGKELDMGTPYDTFDPKSHTMNPNVPAHVKANRKILISGLESEGFHHITTEWWHFSYRRKLYPVTDTPIPCR